MPVSRGLVGKIGASDGLDDEHRGPQSTGLGLTEDKGNYIGRLERGPDGFHETDNS